MKKNAEKAKMRLKKVEDQMYGYEKPKYTRPPDFKLNLPSAERHAHLEKEAEVERARRLGTMVQALIRLGRR